MDGPPVYRVVLADDEADFRKWLRSLLVKRKGSEVVGEANSGTEVLRLVADLTPDVVITDVDMPDGGGLEVARSLQRGWPGIRVILVSADTGQFYERLAEEESALAFIPKTKLSADALLEALQQEV